jgi:arsenate reductase
MLKTSILLLDFSKKLDDDFYPKSKFAAIMTCSQADSDHPFIAGAKKSIPITFEDPKEFDNTSQQAEKHNLRNLQIATELFYVFSQIQS